MNLDKSKNFIAYPTGNKPEWINLNPKCPIVHLCPNDRFGLTQYFLRGFCGVPAGFLRDTLLKDHSWNINTQQELKYNTVFLAKIILPYNIVATYLIHDRKCTIIIKHCQIFYLDATKKP